MTTGVFRYTFEDEWKNLLKGFSLLEVPSTKVYNPEEFDLVPKRSYTEKLIKEKEQRLLSLGERRKNINRQLNEEEKTLKLEIDQLKQKLNP